MYLPYDPWPLSIGLIDCCYFAGLEVLRSKEYTYQWCSSLSVRRFRLVRADPRVNYSEDYGQTDLFFFF